MKNLVIKHQIGNGNYYIIKYFLMHFRIRLLHLFLKEKYLIHQIEDQFQYHLMIWMDHLMVKQDLIINKLYQWIQKNLIIL